MAKPIPYPFVLDELDSVEYRTRRMFGATAIYVPARTGEESERIVLILWEKDDHPEDSGVWLATSHEHHESLRKDFPSMRSIAIFGPGPSSWQVLPANAPDFEESVYRACAMVRSGDPRIGKIPAGRKKKGAASGEKKPRARRVSDEKKLPHPGRRDGEGTAGAKTRNAPKTGRISGASGTKASSTSGAERAKRAKASRASKAKARKRKRS